MTICVEISPAALLERLAEAGIGLRRQGDGLVAWGPVGPLFRSLAVLRARREELIVHLLRSRRASGVQVCTSPKGA